MAVRTSDLHKLLKTNTEQRYFFISNDPRESDWIINPGDTEEVIKAKNRIKQIRQREYAQFDETKQVWSIPLPDFFRNSTSDYKSIYIETFQYFNPKGQSEIGTTFHSPSLLDGNWSQFDGVIGLATLGINRDFPLKTKIDKIEFFFRDYLDLTKNLPKEEAVDVQKIDEHGNLLYLKDVADGDNQTTVETKFPVMIDGEVQESGIGQECVIEEGENTKVLPLYYKTKFKKETTTDTETDPNVLMWPVMSEIEGPLYWMYDPENEDVVEGTIDNIKTNVKTPWPVMIEGKVQKTDESKKPLYYEVKQEETTDVTETPSMETTDKPIRFFIIARLTF